MFHRKTWIIILFSAKNLEILRGSFVSGGIFPGFGTLESVAGDIKINTTEGLFVSNSGINNDIGLNSRGKGGNISIDAGFVSFSDTAQIAALTKGEGNAGNIIIKAKDSVSLTTSALISSNVERDAVGKGGDINITAGSLSLRDGSQLQTIVRPASSTQKAGQGNAGNISIDVTGAADIAGASNSSLSQISSSIEIGVIGNAGNIDIKAGSFSLKDGSGLQSSNSGKQGNAGNVTLNIGGSVDISGAGEVLNANGTKKLFVSQINSFVGTTTIGNAGNITINTNSLSLRDRAQIQSSTFGKGNAGDITINAQDTVSLSGAKTGILSNIDFNGVGNGGNINITGDSLSIKDGAQLQTIIREASGNQLGGKGKAGNVNINVSGTVDIAGAQEALDNSGNKQLFRSAIGSSIGKGAEGGGGDISIEAGSFSLRDGARLSASTFGKGSSGNISIKTKDNVSLTGFGTGIFSTVESGGKGKGGNIDITAGALSLRDASQLVSSTAGAFDSQPAGEGDAGNVTVKVTGAVDIDGRKNGFSSGISSSLNGTKGNGGNIIIDAGSISLRNGAQFRAATSGQGNAGTITVNAVDSITLMGKTDQFSSGFFVTSVSPTGKAGDIFVTAPKVTLDGGKIDANSGYGNGGNIQIGGKIPPEFSSIQGTQIKPVETKLLILRGGAQITTNADGIPQEGGNGGNITITVPNGFIVTAPNENSDISANAFNGSGGKVDIDTRQNFWISPLSRAEVEKRLGTTEPSELNPAFLSTNDITAISQVNPNLSGQVSITPPQIDITAGLSPLPNNVTDPTNQINPNCSAKAIANNSFTSVGRGGIPATPKDPLNEQEIATNWVRLNPQNTLPSTPIAATPASPQPIVEAQGWRRERNGDIVLVAGSSLRTLPRQGQSPSGCVGQ
jgi:large exoprotein involved in heme utilization and adhesion